MRKSRIIRISVVASLALHFLFFGYSNVLWIPGVSGIIEKTKTMFNIGGVELEPRASSAHQTIRGYMDALTFRSPEPSVIPGPHESSRDEKIEAPKLADAELKSRPDVLSAGARPQIREDRERYKERVVVPKRTVSGADEVPEIFEPAKTETVAPVEEEIELPEEFREEMAAYTPAAPAKSLLGKLLPRSGPRSADSDSPYVSLDRFIDVSVYTWRDPGGQGYFKIAIRPGPDAAVLRSIPKEMVFLIDASLSIRENRLEAFKKGIEYCLRNLNPEDRFHLVTFKDTIARYSETSVTSTPDTVTGALRFLDRLEPSERTDIYEAVLKSIRTEPAILPSYVMLLSDGRPTHGIRSSAEIIGQISRINAAQRPVFAFSSGRRVNRYLLDFLAYQNRGWSEYAKNSRTLPSRMAAFYDKIQDPLLQNLRYQFSRINSMEVFPKRLPDFFRNAEFVVYGRYRDEKEFSMRVFGEIGGTTKEFIFARDLSEAKPGSRMIARSWAFNKIYHLIGQMSTRGEDAATKAEIARLSRKFGIQTPYDPDLE